jgi:hypothetical protein
MQLVSEPWNRRVDGVVPLLSWLLLSVAHFPISLKKKEIIIIIIITKRRWNVLCAFGWLFDSLYARFSPLGFRH